MPVYTLCARWRSLLSSKLNAMPKLLHMVLLEHVELFLEHFNPLALVKIKVLNRADSNKPGLLLQDCGQTRICRDRVCGIE